MDPETKVATTEDAPQEETLETAFDVTDAELEQAQEQVETEETTAETQPETVEVQEPEEPQVNWSELGMPQWEGRSLKEIAEYNRNFYRTAGHTQNELGQLRKRLAEYEQKKPEAEPKEAVPEKLSDAEFAAFAAEFNENPLKAMQTYLLPTLTDSLKEKVIEHVNKEFVPKLDLRAKELSDQQEWEQLVASTPDIDEYRQGIFAIMGEDMLGPEVPYRDAYQLAKLYKEDVPAFNETFRWMQRYRMGFDEALGIAQLKKGKPEKTVAQAKADMKKLKGGVKTTKAAAQTTGEIKNMNDAFDIED